jgi:membrane-bound lytic murein transglycosylase A
MRAARLVFCTAAALALAACAGGPKPSGPAPAPPARPAPPPIAAPAPPVSPPTTPYNPLPPPLPPSASSPTPPAEPRAPYVSRGDFRAPPGWDAEDHRAALAAFAAGCVVSKDSAIAAVCRRARALPPQQTERSARDFLEANFQAHPLAGNGLLTGYFAPEYEARASRQGDFTAAVLGKPDDLQVLDLTPFDATLKGKTIIGQITPRGLTPYPTRATIEATAPARPLAWMKPEDLFFLQIQGSGVLTLPDGRRLKAIYAANNGQPFVGIATPMRQRGLLADNNTSGDAIRAWLAANRGQTAAQVMQLDPRYVFFQTAPDDGASPPGAAGVALPPGRAIAVDTARHPLGGFYWIDASAPALAGAFPSYRRAVMALDAGGAIKGDIRADLYVGAGEAAGQEAGRIRHTLTLWRLDPR